MFYVEPQLQHWATAPIFRQPQKATDCADSILRAVDSILKRSQETEGWRRDPEKDMHLFLS